MTSVKFFHSGMAGAPQLSGTAGALIAILDACLVSGLGLRSVDNIVVAGGVATASIATGHSAEPDTVVLIEGVTGASAALLNGERRVSATAANTVSWATTAPAGTYSGGISLRLAPAGWAKAFSGTNLAAYKASPVEATGCVLRVNDTSTTSARVIAYESMSDINTGVGPFPLESQQAGGGFWSKSSAASTATRAWWLVADDRTFYFSCAPGATQLLNHQIVGFGDYLPYKAGPFECVLHYNAADAASATTTPSGCVGAGTTVEGGRAVPRSYTGLGGSRLAARVGMGNHGATSSAGIYSGSSSYAVGNYPNAADNGLMLCRVLLVSDSAYRGELPGLLHVMQGAAGAFASGDVVTGTGAFAGKRLRAVRVGIPSGTTNAVCFFDTTGPWR